MHEGRGENLGESNGNIYYSWKKVSGGMSKCKK